LYLHGFASGPQSTKARWMRERFRELGLELRTPELASEGLERLTITGQLAVIDAILKGSPAAVIGSSLGGYLAALSAARHPEILRVVLMAPAFGFARRWAESLGAEGLAEWERTGGREFQHYAEDRIARVHWGLIEDGRHYEEEPAFSQPALVFHGSQDAVVPVEYSVRWAASRPNAELHVLPSGHELTDQLDSMWARIRPFLSIG
jgi:pimeloyl-ACP methyl ester carboxylesterase